MRPVVTRGSRRALLGLTLGAALCALSIVVAGCGSSAAGATQSVAEPSAFLDSSVLHKISVSFAEEDYGAMIDTYQETGEKDWIEATVTIDGKTYQNVGLRLKGNSSIMGLRRGSAGPAASGANRAGGANMGGSTSTAAPETLPWLIDLDRNVDGQNHGGVIELAVRSSTTATALNEAVSLSLLKEAGLASQQAVYVGLSVNGSEPALRLVIENPDDMWMARNFDIGGTLYKAESSGDYTYRGEDPDSYAEVFDQEAGKKNADLTPLIEFLDFINNADDATFNAELPDRLDIDSFAAYLALEELIANTDDIDGPGNNSYLYYDTKTHKFTVVAWDHNLAFGAMVGGAGAFGGAGVLGGAGGGRAGADLPADNPGGAAGQFPGGMQRPDAAQGAPGAGGGFGGKSNILVERFKASPEWEQVYQDRLAQLRDELYGSGKATDILADWVAVLKTQAASLIDASTVDQEAANISKYFTVQ